MSGEVNLIPAYRRRRRAERRAIGAWGGSLAITVLGAVAAIGLLRFEPQGAAARGVVSKLESVQGRLASTAEQIDAAREELEGLQPVLSIAGQLDQRADWSLLLEAVAESADGLVALERLALVRQESALRVEAAGLAQDHDDCNAFLIALDRIGVFERAHLVQTSRRSTPMGDFVRFEISAPLKRELAP